MPVLVDSAKRRRRPRASIIIEYLGRYNSRAAALLPTDPEAALETRLRDRFYDLYVHQPMQKIVVDRLRPAEPQRPEGVEEARRTLRTAYAAIERPLRADPWAAGERFSLADCAAAPGALLCRQGRAVRWRDVPSIGSYLDRLQHRPSFAARAVVRPSLICTMFPG